MPCRRRSSRLARRPRAQIVVERAMYSSSFAAGTNALATKLQ
jgi:hypothetical protein